jgi:alkanesulfonate monooxygenase SsuD/methylene tetrahydromethanopterin reductase-like flavin-dependent oxidoreductase (luciferase family)
VRHGLLITAQDPPRGERIAARWQEILVAAEAAETARFDSFHVSEHHGLDDGYLPQPLVACAAIAARTSRIGVGTALTVAPLRHPLHLAEEAAVVDVISGGRLILAVGLGNYRPEYELFGVPFEEQGTRFDETLSILTTGLRGDRFDFAGQHFDLRGVAVRPRPVQRPRPPIWVGAMSRRGARRAAEHGLPLLLDPLSTITALEETVAHYRECCAAVGHEPEVVLMRWGWVDARGDSVTEWWPHVRDALWSYVVEIPRVGGADVGSTTSAADLDLEHVQADRLLVGDADEVRRRVDEWTHRLGASTIVVKLQGASGPWGPALLDGIGRYGRQVISSPHDRQEQP